MPLLLLGGGFLGGFLTSKGVDAVGGVVKWTAIGAGGYLAAKHFKLI